MYLLLGFSFGSRGCRKMAGRGKPRSQRKRKTPLKLSQYFDFEENHKQFCEDSTAVAAADKTPRMSGQAPLGSEAHFDQILEQNLQDMTWQPNINNNFGNDTSMNDVTLQPQPATQGICVAGQGIEDQRFVTGSAENQLVPVRQAATMSMAPMSFDSTAVPVGAFVAEKVKDMIRQDKFVKFKDIAKNEIDTSDSESEGEFLEDANGFLKRKKKNKNKKPLSFFAWVEIFTKFSAIRCELEPSLYVMMLKHQEMVQKIAKGKGDWKKYDKKFRKLIAVGQAQWGVVKNELVSEALSMPPRPQHVDKKKNYDKSGGPGPCINFHRNGFCVAKQNCKYSHSCFICQKGVHSAKNCWNRSQRTQGTIAKTQNSGFKFGNKYLQGKKK